MAGKQADIKVGVITNYDDKGLQQAKTGLAGFSNSIKEADGVGGKFAAGWGNIKQQVSAHAGALAIGGGAALIAFGAKAVGAFTETAKAALDLSTATGLSTEQASRWIAVGDDFEVTAEALQTGLGKIAKTMDDAKWAQYGIQTRDAGGAARDTNDILLDSLDMLSNVTNETERAAIGQKLFGKGYQSLTPILGHTRAEYEKMLGTVEKGQVITAEEAKKAEKFRLAQDQLSDALRDVTITIGEQVAGLTPLLGIMTRLIELIGQATTAGGLVGHSFREVTDAMRPMRDEIEAAGLDFADLEQKVIAEGLSLEELNKIVEDAAKANGSLNKEVRDGEKSWETQTEWLDKAAVAASETDRETRKLSGTMSEFPEKVRPSIHAVDTFAESLAALDLTYQALTGKLDEEEAWENVNAKIKEFNDESEKSPELIRDTTREIADYVAHTDTIPAEKKTTILAALEEGDIARAEMLLADLTRTREIYLALTGPGAVTSAGYGVGPHAKGGRIPMREGLSLVGEQGPELISAPGSTVYTAGQTAGMLGGGGMVVNATINVSAGADGYRAGQQIVAALKAYEARSGDDWRRVPR